MIKMSYNSIECKKFPTFQIQEGSYAGNVLHSLPFLGYSMLDSIIFVINEVLGISCHLLYKFITIITNNEPHGGNICPTFLE